MSPYNYCENNPSNNIDIDGKAIFKHGEGYISGYRAEEITKDFMEKAIKGEKVQIDFVVIPNPLEDIRDILSHPLSFGTYHHGVLNLDEILF